MPLCLIFFIVWKFVYFIIVKASVCQKLYFSDLKKLNNKSSRKQNMKSNFKNNETLLISDFL